MKVIQFDFVLVNGEAGVIRSSIFPQYRTNALAVLNEEEEEGENETGCWEERDHVDGVCRCFFSCSLGRNLLVSRRRF